MNIEKVKEILSEDAFVEQIKRMESAEELYVALNERGAGVTEEEVQGACELIIKMEEGKVSANQLSDWQKKGEDGVLTEEDLEYVSGGLMSLFGMICLAAVLVGSMAGCCAGIYFIGKAIRKN